jgi:hypothetical protein
VKALAIARVKEIRRLHEEIGEALRTTLPKAIRVGELLAEQKAECKHGEWLPWCKENLPFSERTAQDYMRFYGRRAELKTATVADLPAARKLLTASKPQKTKVAQAEISIQDESKLPDPVPVAVEIPAAKVERTVFELHLFGLHIIARR